MRTSGRHIPDTGLCGRASVHALPDHLSHQLVLCECIPWGKVITASEAGEIILGVCCVLLKTLPFTIMLSTRNLLYDLVFPPKTSLIIW